MDQFVESLLLLLVLLNPFILSVYLIDLIRELEFRLLARQVVRAAAISMFVFWLFALLGDAIFEDVLQVRFASFLIFGGITFLLVGIRLILGAGPGIQGIRLGADDVSAAIAMPLIIGPGTISASVLAGSRLNKLQAGVVIFLALALMTIAILLFKRLHDYVRQHNERLIQKYMEIAGRATALFVGSFAIEMIMTGLQTWAPSIIGD